MTHRPFAAWPPDDLIHALTDRGVRPGQARSAVRTLAAAFHRDGRPWPDVLALAPKTVAPHLAQLCLPDRPLTLAEDHAAADGTRKLVFCTFDALRIEAVLIPADSGRRTTLCVSSQAGCGRACPFCETGRTGLQRNLVADEIVAQLRGAWALWQACRDTRPPIGNLVFMGMGEPLDNLAEVLDAIAVVTHDLAWGLSARRVTVSTVGVVSQLPAFFAGTRAELALSLHAADDAKRGRLVPANRRWGVAALKQALQEHLPPGRDVFVEVALFAGVNDGPEDADALLVWLQGLPVRVNLLPANPGPDPTLVAPDADTVRRFQKRLLDAGIRAMVRHPHGRDVGGACGQLAGKRLGDPA